MVEFVQCAFDLVRVLDEGLFEQCTQRIQMMLKKVDWLSWCRLWYRINLYFCRWWCRRDKVMEIFFLNG